MMTVFRMMRTCLLMTIPPESRMKRTSRSQGTCMHSQIPMKIITLTITQTLLTTLSANTQTNGNYLQKM